MSLKHRYRQRLLLCTRISDTLPHRPCAAGSPLVSVPVFADLPLLLLAVFAGGDLASLPDACVHTSLLVVAIDMLPLDNGGRMNDMENEEDVGLATLHLPTWSHDSCSGQVLLRVCNPAQKVYQILSSDTPNGSGQSGARHRVLASNITRRVVELHQNPTQTIATLEV